MSQSASDQPPPETQAPLQVVIPAPDIPATPRAITGLPSRRATFDPRARFWFILGILILAISTYLGVKQIAAWSSDRSLVLSGTQVSAKIIDVAGVTQEGRRQPYNEPMKLRFNLPNGSEQVVSGWLRDKPNGENLIRIGQDITIRYDPNLPTRWTDRTIPPAIGPALITFYLLVPVALLAGAAGYWQRSRMLATWRTGKLTPAAVLSASTSPIAPGYAHLVVAPTGSRDGSLTVYVPRSRANPVRGDVVWIIHRESGGPAIAAQAFI